MLACAERGSISSINVERDICQHSHETSYTAGRERTGCFSEGSHMEGPESRLAACNLRASIAPLTFRPPAIWIGEGDLAAHTWTHTPTNSTGSVLDGITSETSRLVPLLAGVIASSVLAPPGALCRASDHSRPLPVKTLKTGCR